LARITVKVDPGSKVEGLSLGEDGTLLVKVKALPVEGKANKAVCRLLAQALGVGRGSVTIVAGHKARRKVVAIDQLTEAELWSRLPVYLAQKKP